MQTDFVKGFLQSHENTHTHTSFGGSINIQVKWVIYKMQGICIASEKSRDFYKLEERQMLFTEKVSFPWMMVPIELERPEK